MWPAATVLNYSIKNIRNEMTYKKYINACIQLTSVGLTHVYPNHSDMIIVERNALLHDDLRSTACIYLIFHHECDILSCVYTINSKCSLYCVKWQGKSLLSGY